MKSLPAIMLACLIPCMASAADAKTGALANGLEAYLELDMEGARLSRFFQALPKTERSKRILEWRSALLKNLGLRSLEEIKRITVTSYRTDEKRTVMQFHVRDGKSVVQSITAFPGYVAVKYKDVTIHHWLSDASKILKMKVSTGNRDAEKKEAKAPADRDKKDETALVDDLLEIPVKRGPLPAYMILDGADRIWVSNNLRTISDVADVLNGGKPELRPLVKPTVQRPASAGAFFHLIAGCDKGGTVKPKYNVKWITFEFGENEGHFFLQGKLICGKKAGPPKEAVQLVALLRGFKAMAMLLADDDDKEAAEAIAALEALKFEIRDTQIHMRWRFPVERLLNLLKEPTPVVKGAKDF